ncbi:hypothetical protein [Mesoterricola silvestris]|uniref:Uncharacterized protein n=1 Tax=Mesoterricola silvestris TaxID=2927979 RepID=A0AA48GN20_9BACT|nr:hypothetical protein [Mesoterricola silvestris]BDU74349.1 hypothetical protein METEAL_35230 [Mesoterricola silvestris]
MSRFLALLLVPVLAGSLAGAPPPPSECVQCHDQVSLETFRTKSHGGLVCTDCHTAVKAIPHGEHLPPVSCARCHKHEDMEFRMSVHGSAKAKGVEHAPGCTTCHGKAHDIVDRGNSASRVARKNMAASCGACHDRAFLDKLHTRIGRRKSLMDLTKEDLR